MADLVAPAPTTTTARRPRAGLRPESLLSSLMVVLLVSVFQRSVGFGRSVLLCRWLDPQELGYWEMSYGFLMLAAPLAVLGLPGSFGVYIERYRQSGQLRLFLRRTASWTLLLAGATIALMAWRRDLVASVVFGDASRAGLAGGVIVCLAVVILHHFFEAVFAGLRMFRVVSAMHFVQSLSFAILAVALVAAWRPAVASVVVGYAGACLISIVGVLAWAAVRVETTPDHGADLAHREFWPPLVRFAIWVWVTNLLTNVFSVVDRYMIIHCGGFGPGEALVQVGNYHTSHIVPVLLISIANLMVGAMTPHLSHDWAAGRQGAVSGRLNLGLKLMTVGMLVAGVAVLLFCPLLFEYAFENKYADGLAVLPWTLAASAWFALLLVAQTFVWCAEKSRRAAAPLAIGLVTNIGMNLLLLPIWGLLGAIVATSIATLVALLSQLAVNQRTGMQVHRGTLLVVFAPALLPAGPAIAAAAALTLLLLAVSRGWIFTPDERRELAETLRERLTRLPGVTRPQTETPTT